MKMKGKERNEAKKNDLSPSRIWRSANELYPGYFAKDSEKRQWITFNSIANIVSFDFRLFIVVKLSRKLDGLKHFTSSFFHLVNGIW